MITRSKTIARLSIVAGAAIAMAATPATANSSADIPVERGSSDSKSKATALGEANGEFRTLFADWRSLDTSERGSVSIPSRMPVDASRVRTSSNFGMRSDPFRGTRRGHKGVDLAGPIGTPIYATADGVVSKAQWFGGYGRYIQIEHGGAMQTRYGHMSRLNVVANQRVRKGEVIGYMGSSGRSTGSHLHYEVRVSGKAVNPLPYMRASEYVSNMEQRLAFEKAQGGPGE